MKVEPFIRYKSPRLRVIATYSLLSVDSFIMSGLNLSLSRLSMALYIRTLKKQPTVLSEWNDTLWTVMVEKAIVHRNGEITFMFYNGTEVRVGE